MGLSSMCSLRRSRSRMQITLEIDPQPKPRMTRQGKYSDRAKRYYKYANDLKWLWKEQAGNAAFPERGAQIVFYIPVFKSWTKKKKMLMMGEPHKQTPDISNLIKALEDALCENDSYIWSYGSIEKRWAETGSIVITTDVP